MKTILVLDDNPQNNDRFIHPLRNYYKVDVVMALSSAERKMKHNRYDLVVIDIMMPIQNLPITNELQTGMEFFNRKIKESYPSQEVIFWTNLTKDSYDSFFPANTAHIDYLQKDKTNVNHLLNKVREILK